MEKKPSTLKIVGLFIFVSGASSLIQDRLKLYDINWVVLEGANIVLFAFTFLNVYFQIKNINNPNPGAIIRGVMAGTFLKMLGLAAAAIIYLLAAGPSRNVNGVFVGMGLYIFYTWLEVKILLQLKPKK